MTHQADHIKKAVKPQKAKIPSLYIHTFENAERLAEIAGAIDAVGWVGEVVTGFKTQGTGRLYAAIVVDHNGTPTHVVRLVRRGIPALNRVSVGLSEAERLSANDAEALKRVLLDATSKRRKHDTLRNYGRLTPAENESAIATIDQVSPFLGDLLRRTAQADDRLLRDYSDHEREIIGLERDAIGIALEIAFDEREKLVLPGISGRPAAFFDMLDAKGHLEDEIILFDKIRFPGLEQIKAANPRTTMFEHNGTVLQVTHANRNALEHTLGVDLIYISHYFGAFVGVQYKMMEGAGSDVAFKPNTHFKEQLQLMKKITNDLSAVGIGADQKNYRLNRTPFYFKFVSRLETNFTDDALCPGMYMPIDLVEQIGTATPPGNIGHRFGTRYLSNSEFAQLIRQGWIGSYKEHIPVLEGMVRDALENKRSLTIAVDRREEDRMRGRRRPTQRSYR